MDIVIKPLIHTVIVYLDDPTFRITGLTGLLTALIFDLLIGSAFRERCPRGEEEKSSGRGVIKLDAPDSLIRAISLACTGLT